jgi:thymidylate synthase (FAD)
MASVEEIKNDSNYRVVHEHGFVGLVDSMGSDGAIARAARTSYQKGTKSVNDDRTLIRYLVRHMHTSPLEMGELVFHIKLPIFVMRQLVRHRTASLNEVSARYSELPAEFYVPEPEYIQPQSTTNKQGRSGEIFNQDKGMIRNLMSDFHKQAYDLYQTFLNAATIAKDYPGLSRELGRIVLPVSIYTECFFKMDLKNFLHMCNLRLDKHAQREIRDFAEIMYAFAKEKFPIVCEAFEDYQLNAKTFSRMELELLKGLIGQSTTFCDIYGCIDAEKLSSAANKLGMSKREITEFMEFINA